MQYEEWVCGGKFTIGHSPEPACICTKNCTPTPYDWSQHRKLKCELCGDDAHTMIDGVLAICLDCDTSCGSFEPSN